MTPARTMSMKRFLPLIIVTCLLAGCVRGNGTDPRVDARRSGAATVSASGTHAIEEQQQQPAPATTTGSRLLPSPEAMTDPVITAKIRASMLADPLLRGADVSVNTTQGVVNLTGAVVSQEQAAIASSHAQRQDGVMRVDNHLSVNLR
jgi:hyperosmotically inducible periplasmic protein